MGERTNRGTFAPGNRAAAGRPKGLATLIHELTNDGRTYTETMVAISKGEAVFGLDITLKDVREACAWLAERAYGKAPQPLEHSGPDGEALQVVVNVLGPEKEGSSD